MVPMRGPGGPMHVSVVGGLSGLPFRRMSPLWAYDRIRVLASPLNH